MVTPCVSCLPLCPQHLLRVWHLVGTHHILVEQINESVLIFLMDKLIHKKYACTRVYMCKIDPCFL